MVAALLLLAGCGGGSEGALGGGPTPSPSPSATATPAREDATPTPPPERAKRPIPPPPAAALRAARRLPLAQQVGQLFLVGFDGTDVTSDVFAELGAHGWGGISISPGNAPTGDLYALFAGEAVAVAQGASRVAPFVLAQLDGGPERLGSNPREGRSNASTSSSASQAVGITLAIQPRINVGLGADAGLIARVAPPAVRGWLAGNVMTAPAHFPGQGAATQDPLDGPASVSLSPAELRGRDLRPFRTALRESPAVTVSSATFPGFDAVTPASLTPAITRELLRRELRFGGMAMTDDLAGVVAATGQSQARSAVAALRAGIDLVYVPDPDARDPVYRAVLGAVRSGELSRARVRDAVARILAVKTRADLR